MKRETKLTPAPLAFPNGGGLKAMSGNGKTLAKKHSAESDALEAEYAAKKAALEHKQEKERQANPAPIVAPGKVTARVKGLDMSKFPKGK